MKVLKILCALLIFSLIGCAGTKENKRHIEDLQHELSVLKGAREKEKKELLVARAQLKEQQKKMVQLSNKVVQNKENIEELKTTTLEVQAPSDLKVIKLGEEPVTIPRPMKAAEIKKAVEEEKAFKKKLTAVKPSPAKKKAPVKRKAPIRNVKKFYKQGLDLFYAGKYAEARVVFNRLANEFSKNHLADNALYWAGEAHYSEDNFEKAIEVFNQVADKYPRGNKAPDALLKAGYTFIVIDKPAKAKEAFKRLIKEYPDSVLTKKAKKQLTSLK